MKRHPRLTAKYDSEVAHKITSTVRTCIAVDIETPIPLPIAK